MYCLSMQIDSNLSPVTMQPKKRFDTEILETFSGVKEKKILSLNFFFPGEGGRAGGWVLSLTFERILWQSYCFPYSNWYFFPLIYMVDLKNESYIIHSKWWAISLLIDTRGVTIHLAHEMRQNTDTWFTRTRQYFNTIFKKFSVTKYLSFNYKK